MPRVSVIIPNYNHARFLQQRIESVLDQTFRDIEVILLDDASTDDSREVLSRYTDDPRVRAIFNDANSGSVFRQWNRGFRESKGEYVWIAESDDYSDVTFLGTLVEKLDANPSAGVAYCQSWMVDESGAVQYLMEDTKQRRAIDPERWKSDFVANGREECARYFTLGCMINNASSALLRRSVVERIGYADEDLTLAGDWMFWVKMLMASDLAFAARPLNYWRQHGGTVRSGAVRGGLWIEESYKVIAHIMRTVEVPEDRAEIARERWFRNWMAYNEDNRYSREQNRRISELARDVDPHLSLRFVRYAPVKPVRLVLKKIRRLVSS